MTSGLTQAADYTIGTPHALAATTTTARYTLASAGLVQYASGGSVPCYMRFHADGARLAVRFGNSTVEASFTAVSTVAVDVLTAVATAAHTVVADGQVDRIRVPDRATHFAIISSAATGHVRFAVASG